MCKDEGEKLMMTANNSNGKNSKKNLLLIDSRLEQMNATVKTPSLLPQEEVWPRFHNLAGQFHATP